MTVCVSLKKSYACLFKLVETGWNRFIYFSDDVIHLAGKFSKEREKGRCDQTSDWEKENHVVVVQLKLNACVWEI